MTAALEWDRHRHACDNIFQTIGNTPLLRLSRVSEGLSSDIFGKLEWFSPTGSLKDRIYYAMFNRAEERGELRPGMKVLECSTGNAGISCAFVSAVKGYPCTIVMPQGMSEERKKLMAAYGANLIFTPGGESDVDLALERLDEERRKEPGLYWVPAQFDNPDNIQAHYLTTGPEIWEQMEGRIDAFVVSQGTGGTISGVGRYLRERDPGVKLYAVEPAECPLLSRREWGPHGIEGIGDGFVPLDLELRLLTGVVTTTTQESVLMARRLAREEGLFCGISSGCNVAAALKLSRAHPEVKRIALMLNDTGQRYFSTALCGEEKGLEVPEREHHLDERSARELDTHQAGWDIIN